MEDAGIECVGGEWFRCNESDVKAAIVAARSNKKIDKERTQDFQLRPEQRQCIIETKKYFDIHADNPEITPHYLWNCKKERVFSGDLIYTCKDVSTAHV